MGQGALTATDGRRCMKTLFLSHGWRGVETTGNHCEVLFGLHHFDRINLHFGGLLHPKYWDMQNAGYFHRGGAVEVDCVQSGNHYGERQDHGVIYLQDTDRSGHYKEGITLPTQCHFLSSEPC